MNTFDVLCSMCTGEYCARHFNEPCDCDVIDRHGDQDCPMIINQEEEMQATYCLGFAVDGPKENVLLIRKNKPTWQAGLLNGVGGKVESNECPIEAMVREFQEETGLKTETFQWTAAGIMEGRTKDNDNKPWIIYIYKAHIRGVTYCKKCGRVTTDTPNQKYCGDGSDKDNGHQYVQRDHIHAGMNSPTDEKLKVVDLRHVSQTTDLIPNLKWMIPLVLDNDLKPFNIVYA